MAWWWKGNPYQVRKERGWKEGEEPEWWHEERAKFLASQAERRRLAARRRIADGSYNVRRPRGATRLPQGDTEQLLYRWSTTLRRSVDEEDRLSVSDLYYGSLRPWAKANGEELRVGERQMSAWMKANGFTCKRTREGTCFIGLKLGSRQVASKGQ
jgi:hypothetical protein